MYFFTGNKSIYWKIEKDRIKNPNSLRACPGNEK